MVSFFSAHTVIGVLSHESKIGQNISTGLEGLFNYMKQKCYDKKIIFL